MSRPRPIDASLHGVTDYMMGTTLLTAFPRLAKLDAQSAKQVRISGAAHAGYSLLTDYPVGAVRVIPYKVHLALDALGAAALAATPFLTGQWKKGRRHWLPHVGLALFELSSLALSDPTGKGDYKADVSAVQTVNMESPAAKIRNGTVAVTPGSARPVS